MVKMPTVAEQLDYLKKGFHEVIREEDLKERLEQCAKAGRPLRVKAGFDPTALAVADFNADGHTDLAVTSAGSNLVQIFLGNGDGAFRTGSNLQFATGVDPVFISTLDVDGDGLLDLAIANQTDNTVSILLGKGDGTFTAATTPAVPAGTEPTSIAVADLNVDGRPDLVVADKTENSVSILLNLGGGLFGPNFELPVDTGPVDTVPVDAVVVDAVLVETVPEVFRIEPRSIFPPMRAISPGGKSTCCSTRPPGTTLIGCDAFGTLASAPVPTATNSFLSFSAVAASGVSTIA